MKKVLMSVIMLSCLEIRMRECHLDLQSGYVSLLRLFSKLMRTDGNKVGDRIRYLYMHVGYLKHNIPLLYIRRTLQDRKET